MYQIRDIVSLVHSKRVLKKLNISSIKTNEVIASLYLE